MSRLILLVIFLTSFLTPETSSFSVKNYRIIGAQYARIGQFPYHISLRDRRYGDHVCGGAIYKSNVVLTAAHCIVSRPLWSLVVRAGTVDRVYGGVDIPVLSRLIHPKFDWVDRNNDIAVLFLKGSLQFGPSIQGVSLPAMNEIFDSGRAAIVTGWRQFQHNSHFAKRLQYLNVTTMNFSECSKVIYITSQMLCAGNRAGETCSGDSGGPLVIDDGNVKKLIGLVSFIPTRDCANPKILTTVYTNVAHFYCWIDSVV